MDLTESERVAARVEELEARYQRRTLSKAELRVADKTARAIGTIKVALLGYGLKLEPEEFQFDLAT